MNRSRLIFMRRNVKGLVLLVAIAYQLLIAIPKNAFTFLLKGRKDLFLAYHKAVMWHFKNMFKPEIHYSPQLIKK
jgi:hypothetical protein